jgi:hypothetical protein
MEHPNLSQSNLVTDKVNVDLDVLRVMMVDRISGHIDNANIVTVHDGRRGNGRVELLEKLTKPTTLVHGMGNHAVLSLITRAGDGRLAHGGPRDQVVAEKNALAERRAPRVRTACLVRVGVCGEGVNQLEAKVETGGQSTLHVAQDALDQREMGLAGIVHEEAHLLDRVGELKIGELQVL